MDFIKLIGESTDRELVGGKGASLSVMHNLGLPVPKGFTITTEAWRAVESGDIKFNALWKKIAAQMGVTFPSFGTGELVSVRSGAARSMPGMMDTILNVGVTTDSQKVLRLNFWRSYSSALGVASDAIQSAIDDYLVSRGSFTIYSLTDTDIARIITGLSGLTKERASIPTTPYTLLKSAVQRVFESWKSDRAVAYRNQFGISHDLGTACTIQLMASGLNGGSGVYLTRNPQTGAPEPVINWASGGQGDSVVDGSSITAGAASLSQEFPALYRELIGIGERLEHVYKDALDIEFTIDSGKLYILQCRAMKRVASATPRIVMDMALDGILDRASVVQYSGEPVVSTSIEPTGKVEVFTTSTPVVPRLVSGKVTMRDEPEPGLILVRYNTTTNDLPHMLAAKAIVTIVGGTLCHAALVAREIGIPAYVGAQNCHIEPGRLRTNTATIKEGDTITILPDGRICKGEVEVAEVSSIDRDYIRLMNLKKLLEAA